MNFLNIGILAHVDAGKTSLTERLLFNAGILKQLGSVDAGNTQTDSMALERQHGITIKSAVATFAIGDTTINLLDTPGHPDFIAEVERVLDVLDGVILVVSAVEGVQAQTRVLMRTLYRLQIPTIIFINKVDRMGADVERVTRDIVSLLKTNAPIYSGSAITGIGIETLTNAVVEYFSPQIDTSDTPAGRIFKIERGAKGEKVAYVRLFSGCLRTRQSISVGVHTAKVTALEVFASGGVRRAAELGAGQIGKVYGLDAARIGDSVGEARAASDSHIAVPTLEAVVFAEDSNDQTALWTALDQLAEQDPLINLRRDEERQEIAISLYGEVQKEVIKETLLTDFHIAARFEPSTTIYIERPTRVAEAVEERPLTSKGYLEWDGISNPFLATIGLRVEPGVPGSGVEFVYAKSVHGKMPLAFFTAIEETIPIALRQGRYGWRVTDCMITLTRVEYYPRQSTSHGGFDKNISSTARDFRNLTPLVLAKALARAGVVVCEPLGAFRLEVPTASVSGVFSVLTKAGVVLKDTMQEDETTVVTGSVPVTQVYQLQRQLPGLTSGEGVFEYEFDRYDEVRGDFPCRPYVGLNPYNQEEYVRKSVK